MKRVFKFIVILFFINFPIFSQTLNNTQVLNTGYPIYDSFNKLCLDQGILVFNENSMLTVGELKFYFSKIDYDKLSVSGKNNYEIVKQFLYSESNLMKTFNDLTGLELADTSAFKFNLNIYANPELYYKSNPDIDWSFNYNFIDNFATAPVQFGLSDYITIEADPFFGKSHIGAVSSDNFCNLPFRPEEPEFLFMKFAYGSAGITFDNWGANFVVGKQGLKIGNTKMASIIYNNTFETDGYLQLNVYSRSFKYSMDIVQVDFTKFLYLHQIELILFNKLKLALIEGSQAVDSLQLRFLNPFMFMHQMSAWNDYSPSDSPYGEQRFCAYFCWMLEFSPFRNTRFYCLYSQNELQSALERRTYEGALYPDSLGVQFGTEIAIPYKNDSYWNITVEGVYTSPYLYVKHTPEASLYRVRNDNLSSDVIKSWIGSPYGPDSIGLQFMFGYERSSKWKVNLGYLFTMKGENDFSMFDEKEESKNPDYEGEYYSYYPRVSEELKTKSYDDAYNDAKNMLPSGIIEYRNQIVLNGEYIINKHLKTDGQIIYTLINNFANISDRFEQGVEIALSFTYHLF